MRQHFEQADAPVVLLQLEMLLMLKRSRQHVKIYINCLILQHLNASIFRDLKPAISSTLKYHHYVIISTLTLCLPRFKAWKPQNSCMSKSSFNVGMLEHVIAEMPKRWKRFGGEMFSTSSLQLWDPNVCGGKWEWEGGTVGRSGWVGGWMEGERVMCARAHQPWLCWCFLGPVPV